MLKDLIERQNRIDKKYGTDEELGALYKNGTTNFKLWAPTAKKVLVEIFDKNNKMNLIKSAKLQKNRMGVWSYQEKEIDLDGYFYKYIVDNKDVFDPYAKSMSVFRLKPNGETIDGDKIGKGAIVDLEKTIKVNPLKIENYENKTDAIIYEIHIRDFTSEEGIKLKNIKGTYNAFIEKLDYIKSLGVTHIQLLPIMKYNFNDEKNKDMEYYWSTKGNNYNWGYDPYSYFSPEGVYSSDPENPYSRINELKNLINEIHLKGMGVILDVVYTHLSDKNLLEDIVSKYYFFYGENGEYVGGFGNNLATTQKMAKRLLLDSIKYWFEEYKIDGMRFDMMGDADSNTIEKAHNIAKSINPQALFIGEGWRTFKGQPYGVKGADQDWSKESNSVGMFSDDFRNILKSGFQKEGKPRFLTNGAIKVRKLFKNIKGQPTNFTPYSPESVVQYIEAHDNATLHDIIAMACKYNTKDNQEDIHKRIRLGNFLVLTSQGIPFLHGGQEYGRSKEWFGKDDPEHKFHKFDFGTYIDDSYDSTDYINSFKWSILDKEENKKTIEFTKNLIKLRKSEKIFRYSTFEEINKNLKLIKPTKDKDLFIAYTNNDYLLIVNGDKKEREILSQDKKYIVLVDGDRASTEEIKDYKNVKFKNNKIVVSPLSAILLKKEAK